MNAQLTIPTLAEIQAKARADAVAEEKAKQVVSSVVPRKRGRPIYIYIGAAALLIGGIYLINKTRG